VISFPSNSALRREVRPAGATRASLP